MDEDSSSAVGVVLLVYVLVILAFTALSIWISIRIARKAGYSGWLAVLACLVPGANLVLMIMFAFNEWPVERAARLAGYPVAYPPSGPEEFSYLPLEHQAYGQQPAVYGTPGYGQPPSPYDQQRFGLQPNGQPQPYPQQPYEAPQYTGQQYGQPQVYASPAELSAQPTSPDAPARNERGDAGNEGPGNQPSGPLPHGYGSYSAEGDGSRFRK